MDDGSLVLLCMCNFKSAKFAIISIVGCLQATVFVGVWLPSRRPIRLVELKPEAKNRNNDLLFFSDRNSVSCSYAGGEHVSVATAASIYGPYTDDRRHPAGTCLGVGYFCV